ncbi:hypothetical protein HaLaN_30409 [Haematococcus lacustris]|uniref:Uncharacterized protein n=1 Tax=Haematococcus lacustris TaxID=44745 RepID=A0A6A0AF73_HAELA|nr:hypothetical protein HaLaN_30409 [Haematococcus lacustris]
MSGCVLGHVGDTKHSAPGTAQLHYHLTTNSTTIACLSPAATYKSQYWAGKLAAQKATTGRQHRTPSIQHTTCGPKPRQQWQQCVAPITSNPTCNAGQSGSGARGQSPGPAAKKKVGSAAAGKGQRKQCVLSVVLAQGKAAPTLALAAAGRGGSHGAAIATQWEQVAMGTMPGCAVGGALYGCPLEVPFDGARVNDIASWWRKTSKEAVCRPRGTDQRQGRVVLVDEHRTTRVSSAVNGQQPCERQLNKRRATRPADWKPPAGQVHHRLERPAWSQQRDQPVRGLMWCPVVAPRKPPQAPCSSQEASQPAASEPGPSTPLPAYPCQPTST